MAAKKTRSVGNNRIENVAVFSFAIPPGPLQPDSHVPPSCAISTASEQRLKQPCLYFQRCAASRSMANSPEDPPRCSLARSDSSSSLPLPCHWRTATQSPSPAPHSSPASLRSSHPTYQPPQIHSGRSTRTASAVQCASARRRLMGRRRMGLG
ncbi:hypothetical protein B0H12DRAFT_1108924 [Mycena haematopus]|nr:hypothetical protein B0H12DRAFT_1108924 [Mycena haematopus]